MKIVHVITRLIVGGAQENTLLSCEGLHARGHDVYLITGPSVGREGTLMDRAQGGGYHVILEPHLVREPSPRHDLAAYRSLKRRVGELKPDIWHTHSSKAGIIGRVAAYGRGPIVVHTIHGLPFHPYQSRVAFHAWAALERFAAGRCDKLVVVADAMRNQALAQGVGKADQYVTIRSGMEIAKYRYSASARDEVRRRFNIPNSRVVFGTIARLQPLKGHADILAIAPLLIKANPNIHFMWMGDGVFFNTFSQRIQELKLQDHFTLTGLLPPDEVGGFISALDVLIHPSYREGLPRAVPQAMLAGVPSITYDCDGAGEVCVNGETGVLIRPGDQQALRAAIEKLSVDAHWRKQLGHSGRILAEREFSAADMVQRLEQLYQQLMHRNVRNPS